NSLADAITTAYQAGDMEQVVALGEQAAPTSEASLFWLGVARQNTGRYAQAAMAFRQLTQMRPQVSAYWNNLALACRQDGDLVAAERALGTAHSLAPNDAEVHFNLGLLQLQQRRWVSARQSLMDAVRLSPGFIEARLQAAHACHVCGDNDGQQAMLAGARDWSGQPGEQALLLAAMLSAQGELDAALRALDRALLPSHDEAGVMPLRITAQQVAL